MSEGMACFNLIKKREKQNTHDERILVARVFLLGIRVREGERVRKGEVNPVSFFGLNCNGME